MNAFAKFINYRWRRGRGGPECKTESHQCHFQGLEIIYAQNKHSVVQPDIPTNEGTNERTNRKDFDLNEILSLFRFKLPNSFLVSFRHAWSHFGWHHTCRANIYCNFALILFIRSFNSLRKEIQIYFFHIVFVYISALQYLGLTGCQWLWLWL